MTDRQLAGAAAAAAAVAILVWAAASGSLRMSVTADTGAGPPAPAGLPHRHPLFRRPDYPGCHITRISRGGWAWYLDPPSSEGL